MKITHIASLVSMVGIVALLMSATVQAQTTGAPGANDFTINGTGSGGTSPIDPGLLSATTSVSLAVSGPPGLPIFGLSSAALSAPLAVPPIAPPTSLDIDITASFTIWLPGASIIPGFAIGNILDGNGDWVLTIPTAFVGGETFNLQMAILDPTTGQFTMTPAHSGTVSGFNGLVTTLLIGGTGNSSHTLTQNSVDYYGLNYTSFHVYSMGYMKFEMNGGGTSDFSEDLQEFWIGIPNNAAGGAPAVAACWSDYQPNGVGGALDGTISVLENFSDGSVAIEWANMHYFQGSEPAGTFRVTFGTPTAGAGSVTFDLSAVAPALVSPASQMHSQIVGVTNGNVAVGALTDLSNPTQTGLTSARGIYISTAPNDSIAEVYPPNTLVGSTVGVLEFADGGPFPGNGTWAILP